MSIGNVNFQGVQGPQAVNAAQTVSTSVPVDCSSRPDEFVKSDKAEQP